MSTICYEYNRDIVETLYLTKSNTSDAFTYLLNLDIPSEVACTIIEKFESELINQHIHKRK